MNNNKNISPETLKNQLLQIENFSFRKKTIICVSGGVDSMAMLHLSASILKNIIAVTVDHKYRKESTSEAKFVAKACTKLGIEHYILSNTKKIPTQNIESFLREIRYNLIIEFAKKHKITQALLAHHLNDNVETFFMRLERGSGLQGLACMQNISIKNGINFYRPLLNITKNDLINFATENKIKWVEDSSNKDQKFMRNNIRDFLSKITDAEIFTNRVAQTISSLSEAQKIIDDLEKTITNNIVKNTKDAVLINYQKFFEQPEALALRILKNILIKQNPKNKIPRFDSLKLLYNNLKDKNFKKQTLNGSIIELKQNNIIIKNEVKTLKIKTK